MKIGECKRRKGEETKRPRDEKIEWLVTGEKLKVGKCGGWEPRVEHGAGSLE